MDEHLRPISENAKESVSENELLLRQVFQSLPIGVWILDKTGKIVFGNPEAERIWGGALYVGIEKYGEYKGWWYDSGKKIEAGEWAAVRAVTKGETSINEIIRIQCFDGSYKTILNSAAPTREGNGGITGALILNQDITEKTAVEQEMVKLSTAVDLASDWILITDTAGTIEYVNKAVVEISGYSKAELIGENPRLLKSDRHDREFYVEFWKSILEGNTLSVILTNRRKNGELFDLYHTIRPLKDKQGRITHFVSSAKDLSRQKILEERIQYLSYYDVLTELPNRALFIDRLDQSISRAVHNKRIVAVMIVDIDRFTLLNETYGPKAGDALLIGVGGMLSSRLRDGDTVARIGSDEFGLILTDVADSEDVIVIAGKILESFRTGFSVGREDISVGVSIGISVFPNDGHYSYSLVGNSDIALRKAKEGGMNTYRFFTAEMNLKALEFVQMEKHLADAISKNEFILNFQPYYDVTSKKCAGMETLLRWNSGSLGLVPPSRFIPLLEETGRIVEVGKWIIDSVCSIIRKWKDDGLPEFPVTVNLSQVQFRDKNLIHDIETAIKKHDVDPRMLCFEITESTSMMDAEFTRSVLDRLKKLGSAVYIDDFGTGYSSLSYLKKLPIDVIKIDISFIRDVARDPDDATIVSTIIQLAHGLNLKTIAEGVETIEQWNILQVLHCDMIQGYYMSKPMPGPEMESLLRNL